MGKQKIEMVGRKFGKLTVVSEAPKNKYNQYVWNCVCECGNAVIANGSGLRAGYNLSCGCGRVVSSIEAGKKRRRCQEGMLHELDQKTYNTLLSIYRSMLRRASPEYAAPENYYNRGVTICSEWQEDNPDGFKNFAEWALTGGGWSVGLDLDKEAVNQDNLVYSPKYCKFVKTSVNLCRRRKKAGRNFLGTFRLRSGRFSYKLALDHRIFRSEVFFEIEEEAAIARDLYIIENKLPHRLNFPELRNEHQLK